MRILFVNYSFDRKFHAGVASLSAYMKRGGHDTSLIIYDSSVTEESFKQRIRDYDPGIIAFTVMTYQWEPTQHLMHMTREVTKAPIICGGYHPTLYPDDVIQDPNCDVACLGEGEVPMLELVNRLEKGEPFHDIPGLVTKECETGRVPVVHRNPIEPIVDDMDEFPFWDREIFDVDSLLGTRGLGTLAHTRHTLAVGAGRGCPDQCTYCSAPAMMRFYRGAGRWIRKRSPEHLVRELVELKEKYDVKIFEFWDERIDIYPAWLEKFCKLYKKEVGLPWSADMRVERATMDILKPMADSGCYMVWFGVESGNEEYRSKYLKRWMSNDQILQAFKNCRDLGMETLSLNMVGLPDETADMARETIEINRKMRADNLLFFTYQSFPGTELGEYSMAMNMVPDASVFWYERPETCLVQQSMTKEELQELWKEWRELQMELEAERRARGSLVFELDPDEPAALIRI